MKTLSAPTGDLQFEVIDGIESVVQRVTQRLHFWLGQWFLHTDRGVPYVQDILGHRNLDTQISEEIITDAIVSVPDVIRVEDAEVTFNSLTRTLHYSATVITIFGDFRVLDPSISLDTAPIDFIDDRLPADNDTLTWLNEPVTWRGEELTWR